MKRSLLVLALVASPALAHAQTESCETTSDCRVGSHCIESVCRTLGDVPRARPYGLQIVLADVAAAGTLGTFSVFSGPIVHLAHNRPQTALASFGLRVGGIALSAATGVAIAFALPPMSFNALGCMDCGPSPNYLPQAFGGMLIGAGIGWIVASVIDAVFLAHPRVKGTSSVAARSY
jgi:hypothetical protein